MRPGNGEGDGPTEVEATLLVAPDGGEELADEVAGVEEVSGYRIRARDRTVLDDVYLDTPDGALGRAGLALRLRRAGGSTVVAVKG
ncbi:MAG: CYTH domain-containing protein, partial [Gemmatimonadota bacterium]